MLFTTVIVEGISSEELYNIRLLRKHEICWQLLARWHVNGVYTVVNKLLGPVYTWRTGTLTGVKFNNN